VFGFEEEEEWAGCEVSNISLGVALLFDEEVLKAGLGLNGGAKVLGTPDLRLNLPARNPSLNARGLDGSPASFGLVPSLGELFCIIPAAAAAAAAC
jgi:hypothetical protein